MENHWVETLKGVHLAFESIELWAVKIQLELQVKRANLWGRKTEGLVFYAWEHLALTRALGSDRSSWLLATRQ